MCWIRLEKKKKDKKQTLKLRRKLQQEVEANSTFGKQRFLFLSVVLIEGFN